MKSPTSSRRSRTQEDADVGDPSRSGHNPPGIHPGGAAADLLDGSQKHSDIQCQRAAVEPPAPGRNTADSQSSHAGDTSSVSSQPDTDTPMAAAADGLSSSQPSPITHAPSNDRTSDGWLELRIWAEMFADAQQQRIAATNRAERGGVDPAVYAAYTEALETAEHVCGLALRRCFRRVVPAEIVGWQKNQLGIGEHLMARLLGHLGHPRHATPHHWEGEGSSRVLIADEPYERTVSQLWAYCGHGDPTRRPRKGMTADEASGCGNPTLKMLVHLNAEACVKAGVRKHEGAPVKFDPDTRYAISELGEVYLEARRLYAKHDDWSDGHQQNAALRKVGKELLKRLWRVSRGGTSE